MKNTTVLFGSMIFLGIIFITNLSYAGGGGAAAAAGGMADEARKAQNMASEMMSKGGINSKVFQKADEFLEERFPGLIKGNWSASRDGFTRPPKVIAAGNFAILKWDGQIVVFDCGIWSCTVLYKGDWTMWLK